MINLFIDKSRFSKYLIDVVRINLKSDEFLKEEMNKINEMRKVVYNVHYDCVCDQIPDKDGLPVLIPVASWDEFNSSTYEAMLSMIIFNNLCIENRERRWLIASILGSYYEKYCDGNLISEEYLRLNKIGGYFGNANGNERGWESLGSERDMDNIDLQYPQDDRER